MVVSVTFVCRIHPYADEILLKFDQYLTGLLVGGGIIIFRMF
jgi:hypothetical protein